MSSKTSAALWVSLWSTELTLSTDSASLNCSRSRLLSLEGFLFRVSLILVLVHPLPVRIARKVLTGGASNRLDRASTLSPAL